MRGEFDFIQNIKEKYDLKSVGDDCAVLPKDEQTDMLVTADMLVEDVDFRIDWTTPELLGQKALAVSLSDIAAMGGVPENALLSIGVPQKVWDSDFLDRFYEGWHTLARKFEVKLRGGDVSRTPDKLVIDSIVIGTVPKGEAVLRSGARPGDAIFVSGSVGGAAAGLSLLESGTSYKTAERRQKAVIARQLRPVPRVEVGIFLRRNGIASAMIDISDGIAADLHHICDASGVGARVEADAIPFDANIRDLSPPADAALPRTGEDFELLFTASGEKISLLENGDFSRIGTITENAGEVMVIARGQQWIAPPIGYTHF